MRLSITPRFKQQTSAHYRTSPYLHFFSLNVLNSQQFIHFDHTKLTSCETTATTLVVIRDLHKDFLSVSNDILLNRNPLFYLRRWQ
jgi:hypothetical protein